MAGFDRTPSEMPSFEHPPKYIEGPGGGPAFPTSPGPVGGRYTAAEKEMFDELADMSVYIAGAATIVAGASAFGGPAGAPSVAVWTVVAGIWAVNSQLFSDMAEDPPQPDYRRIVSFRPRASAPPGHADPVLGPVAIAAQRGVLLLVTAGGSLDAVERLQGAAAAGDRDWALVHKGVAVQARWALAVDLALWAAALQAAGRTVTGTPHDRPLAPGARAGTAWLDEPSAGEALRRAGLTVAEAERALTSLRSDRPYRGPASSIGAQLSATATRIYRLATRLGALGG